MSEPITNVSKDVEIELMEQKIEAQRQYCIDNSVPFFAQRKVCAECKKPWALCGPGEKITLKAAGSMHITGCPHTSYSGSEGIL